MEFKIKNAMEDKFGNVKENIFLALDADNQYLGNGYVYPVIHHHQTCDTPYLLYCDISVEAEMNVSEKEKIQQALFEAVNKRAMELRNEHPELTARVYTGFTPDENKMKFYVENGWEEDYSIFMDHELTGTETMTLPVGLTVEEFDLKDEKKANDFLLLYNSYFVTPMDINEFKEAQEQETSFKNFYFYKNGQLVGECTVREEDGCGFIEILFVLETARGQGISKIIMNYIHGYFVNRGLKKSILEVWELNHRAISLYKKMGYKKCGNNYMFPGITLK